MSSEGFQPHEAERKKRKKKFQVEEITMDQISPLAHAGGYDQSNVAGLMEAAGWKASGTVTTQKMTNS